MKQDLNGVRTPQDVIRRFDFEDIPVLVKSTKEIALEVSKKVGDNEIISKINLSPEEATINADKISLQGKTIDLTSNEIEITSKHFKLDSGGNMVCNNAEINGSITSTEGHIGGWEITNQGLTNGAVKVNSDGSTTIYTVADLIIMRGYIMGLEGFNLSSSMIAHYDLNGDGQVTALDYVILQNLIGISMND